MCLVPILCSAGQAEPLEVSFPSPEPCPGTAGPGTIRDDRSNIPIHQKPTVGESMGLNSNYKFHSLPAYNPLASINTVSTLG